MDNLPTVLMEAMAACLPVVSTLDRGRPEMVADGVTGLLVPARQPAALAEALASYCWQIGALARSLGKAGRQRAADLFAIEKSVQELRADFSSHLACLEREAAGHDPGNEELFSRS